MDELAQQLAGSFSVSNDPNSTAAPHPRFAQYKGRSSVDQNTRRERILKHQKQQRFDYMSHIRNLSEDLWDNTDAESISSEDSMDVQFEGEVPKFRKPGKYYRNQLMYSEWLVEVPEDFETEWLTVVCPWGKRCLVVASKGRTHAYSKSGYRINSFSSHLPGGSFKQKGRNKDNVILDCLFNEQEGTYYVLDIMCWKNHPIYDSETEFRFYWLASKVIETPEMAEKSPDNPYNFIPLPNYPCTREAISHAVNAATFDIDGVLFYHKRCHYTFGSTPLVVWLKPYMLPEILNINISEKLAAERPDSYTNYAAHMEHVQKEKEKAALEKKARKGKSPQGKKKTPSKKAGGGDGPGLVEVGKDHGLPEPKPVKKDKLEEKKIYGQDFRMDLMFSEWLTEVPEDLATNWFVMACPTGKRHLVLASEGTTVSQSKRGIIVDAFNSLLPGGYPYSTCDKDMCIVDTIYNKKTDTYYIMDGLVWTTQVLYDCEAEFRFFWLREMVREIRGLGKMSRNNGHAIKLLRTFPATEDGISQALKSAIYEVDGVLFFKKNGTYKAGASDNVLWLKPYMIPDFFPQADVPKELMQRKPNQYDPEAHKEKVEKEKKERKSNPAVARRRRVDERPVDIDRIVDDIAKMYISKQRGNEEAIRKRQERDLEANLTRMQAMRNQGQRGGRQMQNRSYTDFGYDNSGYGNQGYNDYGYQGYDDYGYQGYDDYGYQGYDDYGYQGYDDYGYQGYDDNNYGGMMGYGGGYQGMMGCGRGSWGYERHDSKKGSGKGRGVKPLTAYHQTHTKFCK